MAWCAKSILTRSNYFANQPPIVLYLYVVGWYMEIESGTSGTAVRPSIQVSLYVLLLLQI